MAQPTPRARTILLTDAGTAVYSADLAAYDGALGGLPSIENTRASSLLPAGSVAGATAAFTQLYARAAAIAARMSAQSSRREDLSTRIAALEAN